MSKIPKIKVSIYDEDLDENVEVELPGKYEICHTCEGTGSHVNRNIDGHGITEDEWNGPDWDDEDREMYKSGGYDVICTECKGSRVVLEVDESLCTSEELKKTLETYYEHLNDDYEYDRECEMERRMGC